MKRKADKTIREAQEIRSEIAKAGGKRPMCEKRAKVRGPDRQPILDAEGNFQWKPCGNRAMPGATICHKHGKAPQIRKRAERRLLSMVDPTLARMEYLRDQNAHLPTAMMACKEILNRAGGASLGPVNPTETKTGEGQRPILIGIQVGGINPAKAPQLEAKVIDLDE